MPVAHTLLPGQDAGDRAAVHGLLKDHYVENAGGEFRIFYSEAFLEWDMCGHALSEAIPGSSTWQVGILSLTLTLTLTGWQVGVRDTTGRLVGFLSGIPITLQV